MSPPARRVSVVIAVYQGEQCVLAAIQSALAQTHTNLEILVIDDGSTDGTWQQLQSIEDSRVRIFRQENAGASTARNLGISHATGEFIALLDADDRWLPDKLERELRTLEENGNPVGIAYSWWYSVDEDGMLLRKSPAPSYSGHVLGDLLSGPLFIIPSASLFHKAIFDDLGGFDTKRLYHEDCAFVLRACRKYPAFPTRHYSVLYQQSMSGKARRILRDHDLAVKAALSIATDVQDVLSESEAKRLLDTLRRELYFQFLMYGFNASAARLLEDIDVSSLRGGAKGWIGWVFAKTRINLMMPTRQIVQFMYRTFQKSSWRRFLEQSGVAKSDEYRTGASAAPIGTVTTSV
jgi:glycosyltransferase involved in cell wall biosynthesis